MSGSHAYAYSVFFYFVGAWPTKVPKNQARENQASKNQEGKPTKYGNKMALILPKISTAFVSNDIVYAR